MTSITQEPRELTGSPRPSWGAAFAAAFLGWAFASMAVGGLSIAAWELGLMGRPYGDGLRDWPYPEAGWSSLGANTIVWLWIFAATALLIRGLLADRSERPVSAAIIFIIIVATGFAPLPHGLLEPEWPVALILTAALLRLAPGAGPDPLPKRTTAKLIALGTGLLIIPAAHGLMHPLWQGSVFGFEPMPRNATHLTVRNAGFATVELESVSLQMPMPFVELVGVRVADPPPFVDRRSPSLPFELDSRSEAFLELQLRQRGCGTGGPVRGQARLRYEVFGVRRTEALPIEIPIRRC
jgi:hypothetical protein